MRDELRTHRNGATAIVAPEGPLEGGAVHELEQHLDDLLRQGEGYFVIDLSAVEAVDSHALRVLLMVAKRLRGQEGRLILCGVRPGVREILDISGFDSIFEVAAGVEPALLELPPEASHTGTAAWIAQRLGCDATPEARISSLENSLWQRHVRRAIAGLEVALDLTSDSPEPAS